MHPHNMTPEREALDIAVYNWVKSLGINADTFDYDPIDQVFNQLEAQAH